MIGAAAAVASATDQIAVIAEYRAVGTVSTRALANTSYLHALGANVRAPALAEIVRLGRLLTACARMSRMSLHGHHPLREAACTRDGWSRVPAAQG